MSIREFYQSYAQMIKQQPICLKFNHLHNILDSVSI